MRPAARRLVAIFAIVSIAQLASQLSAREPRSTDTLQSDVRRLLEGLNAPTRVERAAAERGLLELGPAVLDHLPAPELVESPSVQVALDRVRHELERRKALASLSASEVSLSGRKSFGDWAAEISRQTRNPLNVTSLPQDVQSRVWELDWPKREFWGALDELAALANVQFEPDPSRRALRFLPADPTRAPPAPKTASAGPFRLTAFPVEQRGGEENLPTKGDNAIAAAPALLRLNLLVQTEPRLRPLFLKYAARDLRLTVPPATALRPLSPEATYEAAVAEGGAARVQCDYLRPRAGLADSLSFSGKFHITLAADSAPVRFVDVTRNADGKALGIARRRGGVTVRLERVRRERGEQGVDLLVQAVVVYDRGGPAFESHRSWVLHNEAYLEDAKGNRLPLNAGFETTLQADGAVGMEYRFAGLPDPLPDYAFVYVVPTLIVEAPVEFEIESVPLRLSP